MSQPTSHWQNNKPVNNNWSHLTLTALEEEYVEHLRAEAIFLSNLDDNDI